MGLGQGGSCVISRNNEKGDENRRCGGLPLQSGLCERER